ncbi:hypothetical protein [Caballeronia sp. ATUFL_M2_KS44]|uniref:hypothetical protein n=1 Tax=Caballeronia sp. ATUFL_M2_KS44 TaxID=2921767 RepID=UPI0020292457|nr:hypothetical protein [Caballeronia sp. ATUFL_M2_KS44]
MKKTITLEGVEASEISMELDFCSIAARAHAAADALMSDDRLRHALERELDALLSSPEDRGEGRDAPPLTRQRADWETVRTLAVTAARARDVDGARSARHAAEALSFVYAGLHSALGG